MVHSAVSPLLHGQLLTPAQETGGSCLGGTTVLVFKASKSFEFAVKPEQRAKVWNRLRDVPGEVTTVGSVKQKTKLCVRPPAVLVLIFSHPSPQPQGNVIQSIRPPTVLFSSSALAPLLNACASFLSYCFALHVSTMCCNFKYAYE